MASIRGKNTQPERILRSALWATGTRFRIHDRTVPGRPDISHKGAKVAVFVDGCFWHGCPHHYIAPVNNKEFWQRKVEANKERRNRVLVDLELQGWMAEQIWECQLQDSTDILARNLAKTIKERRVSVQQTTIPSSTRALRR